MHVSAKWAVLLRPTHGRTHKAETSLFCYKAIANLTGQNAANIVATVPCCS